MNDSWDVERVRAGEDGVWRGIRYQGRAAATRGEIGEAATSHRVSCHPSMGAAIMASRGSSQVPYGVTIKGLFRGDLFCL